MWLSQPFTNPDHFWGRPNTTSLYSARIEALKQANPDASLPIPMDLITASASGLDPDISLAGARYQIPRIAKARIYPKHN